MLSCSSPVPQPVSPAPFVTTTRSEPPARDRVETHPVDMASFTELVAKPLEAPALQSPPRRCCTKPPPVLAPRHSSRLAKKAINRMPAVADMKNILIWKLGLAIGPQVDTTEFEKYLKIFQEGLFKEQAKMIGNLFAAQLPLLEEHAVEVEEES
jgi:hypothetical protein